MTAEPPDGRGAPSTEGGSTPRPNRRRDGKGKAKPRSALIFISGLSGSIVDQSLDGTVRRIGAAMDRSAKTGSAKFTLDSRTERSDLGDGFVVEHRTITRSGSDCALDVWQLATGPTLTADYSAASPIRQGLLGGLVALRSLPKAARAWHGRAAKTSKERGQLLIAGLLLALIAVYLVGLIVGLAASFADAPWMPSWASGVLLAITGLGIWKARVVQEIANGAVEANASFQYLDHGYRADVLRGRLEQLLEYVAEQEDVEYDRVDLIGYSFGSVVAIDALYPAADVPGPRFDQIRTFVTIGCPFDIIQTYWPSYFTNRWYRDRVPRQWLNVYARLDVLGSDFHDVQGEEIGVELGDLVARPQSARWRVPGDDDGLSPLQVLLMVGIKAHAMYWGPRFEQEDTAFGPVVRHLYADHPLLA